MRLTLALALFAALAASCRTVVITPELVRDCDAPLADKARTLATWNAAVARANEFLASPFRRTLPPGAIELGDAGMHFVEAEPPRTRWPLAVECTDWGDLLVAVGFAAQESPRGFTIGATRVRGQRALENSLFRACDDDGWLPPESVAELVLHELTHDWSGEGALGFAKSFDYYLESLAHGYDEHPDERRANATSEEFEFFARTLGRGPAEREAALSDLEQHLAASRASKHCGHGSFNATPRAPRP